MWPWIYTENTDDTDHLGSPNADASAGIPVEMLTVFHRVWNVFTFLKDCGHGNRIATIYPQSKCGDAFRAEHGVIVLSRVVSVLVGLQKKCDDMRIECDSHPQILAGHVSAG